MKCQITFPIGEWSINEANGLRTYVQRLEQYLNLENEPRFGESLLILFNQSQFFLKDKVVLNSSACFFFVCLSRVVSANYYELNLMVFFCLVCSLRGDPHINVIESYSAFFEKIDKRF